MKQIKILKKFSLTLGILTVLCLIRPVDIKAEPTAYNLWVGQHQVTDANKDNIPGVTGEPGAYAKFDPATNTLTFVGKVTGFEGQKEVTISKKDYTCKLLSEGMALIIDGDLTLDHENAMGIVVRDGGLTINGRIELDGADLKTDSYGLYMEETTRQAYDLVINGSLISDDWIEGNDTYTGYKKPGKFIINGTLKSGSYVCIAKPLELSPEGQIEGRFFRIRDTGKSVIAGKVRLYQSNTDKKYYDDICLHIPVLEVNSPADIRIETEINNSGYLYEYNAIGGNSCTVNGGKINLIGKGKKFCGVYSSLTLKGGEVNIEMTGADSVGFYYLGSVIIEGGKLSVRGLGENNKGIVYSNSLKPIGGCLLIETTGVCFSGGDFAPENSVVHAKSTSSDPGLKSFSCSPYYPVDVTMRLPAGGAYDSGEKTFLEKDGTYAKELFLISNTHVHKRPEEVEVALAPTCETAGLTGAIYCYECGEKISDGESIPPLGHDWGEWQVVKAPTKKETGLEKRVCKRDPSHSQTREIAKLPAGTVSENDADPGTGGDEKDPGSSSGSGRKDPDPDSPGSRSDKDTDAAAGRPFSEIEKTVLGSIDDKDLGGSTFYLLKAKGVGKKRAVKLSWKKVPGAVKYVIYGNKCGKKNSYQKIKTVKKTSFTAKKLKQGTYYKYLIVAVDSKETTLALSKTIHVVTNGGKRGNNTGVSLNKKKLNLSVGKTGKVKAKLKHGKKKVSLHRKVAWESDDPEVAEVKDGKITAHKKGNCTIYAYAQNGLCAKLTVKVGD